VPVDPPLIDDVRPQALARPATVAELGDLVRRAAAEGFGLFPVGGATHLHIGLPPVKPGVAVDMTALDQVIDYPARDMTVTVRAGITIAKLHAILAAENQRLPIDVADPERATLGGAIAVNASGPRRFGFGTLRDYVIGISFMDDAGNEVKAGGRVVKNVAGYDLCKLHIGALGTLGIVTQVTLKLKPTPEERAVMIFSFHHGFDEVTDLLDRVHRSQTRPAVVDVISNRPSERRLVIGYEDNSEAVAWQIASIQKELGASHFELHTGDQAEFNWPFVTDPQAKLAFQANLLPSALPTFFDRLLEFPQLIWQAHAGNGIIIGRSHTDLPLDTAVNAMTALREIAVAAQGNLIVTRCPPAWKRELKIWGEPRGDLALMRAVKRELDPRNLFNPGRFLV
jgi:glycolate oxidase FAD binding subunit